MTESTARPVLAALWMLGATASFSTMALAGRSVAMELDTFELMFYRSLIGIAIVLSVGATAGTLSQITTRHMGVHTMRNIGHFAGQNLWFYAVTVLPLAQVFAFEFTSPLWVALLAPLVLAERMTVTRGIAAALGFIGLLIVARPGSGLEISPGLIAAVTCALGFAISALATKLLTRTETVTCILFWLTIMQAVFGLICAGYDGDIALPRNTIWFVILIAFAGLAAHFCMTTALSLAPVAVVMPLDFTRLPLIAVLGLILYGEPIEIAVLAGGALIFGSNLLNILVEHRKKRAAL